MHTILRRCVGALSCVLLAGMLAACGSDSGNSATGAQSSTGTSASEATPACNPTPATAATINVGLIGTFSAKPTLIPTATEMTGGAQAYLGSRNDCGGVNGHKVNLVTGDDQGDANTGLAETKRLVENEHVVDLVEVTSSTTLDAIMPYLTSAQVPVASTGGSLLESFEPVNPWLFSASTPYEYQGAAVAKFLLDKKMSHVAVITLNRGTGFSYVQGLKPALEAGGGTIVDEEDVTADVTDFTTQARKIQGANPDIIICHSAAGQCAAAAKSAQSIGLDTPFLMGPGATSPNLVDLAGGAAAVEGFYGESPFLSFDNPSSAMKHFLADMAKYSPKVPISYFSLFGYEAARATADAIAAAGATVTGASVRDALEHLSGDYGVFPPFKLSGENHLMNTATQILQFKDGKIVGVGDLINIPLGSVKPYVGP